MATGLRDLRRKMKGIKSTRQVTKAMELVAASKMRKAVQHAQTLRRYAHAAWQILTQLADLNPNMHPFLEKRPVRKVLAILISTDRGLCGSMNTQLFRTTLQYVRELRSLPGFQSLSFIAAGRKAQQFLARSGLDVIGAFPAFSNRPSFKDTLPLTRMAMDGYLKNEFDTVVLLYTDFVSALVQEPVIKQLLPFSRTDLKSMIESILPQRQGKPAEQLAPASGAHAQHLFEPSPEAVLQTILPQLTEVQLYQSVLETSASEHSARMVAMRNATDNASDLLEGLSLVYNQTRQANITTELSELSAAQAAIAG